MKETILKLIKEAQKIKTSKNADNSLPSNAYYMDNGDILFPDRKYGDARYPYEMDGMNLWAHSNGYINACESRLTILRTAFFQEDTCIDFWGGIKTNENEWFPISVLGPNKQLFEPFSVERYTVYSKRCAYYITDTEKLIFAVRASITTKKQLNFTFTVINKTDEPQEIYLASYMDFMLHYVNDESFWGLMSRFGKLYDNGSFKLYKRQNIYNIAVINKLINVNSPYDVQSTVSKSVFIGQSGNSLVNAKSLKDGCFEKIIHSANTANYAIASDIIKFTLEASGEASVNYLVNIVTDMKEADRLVNNKVDMAWIEKDIEIQTEKENEKLSNISVSFDKMEIPSINSHVFNNFFKNVQKQVDLCALGKNYAGSLIGVRDVFQQLDTSILWNTKDSRKKIITALNYIMSDGRSPRQFSVPPLPDMIPEFDMREYIDQGVWIIETLYNYLSFTDDYSILDEKCDFYKIIDEEKRIFEKDKPDTVLMHLMKITDYLISNIDSDTNCLKILFGDWNDAFNGLGKTKDEGKNFGNGVSVMATLQLYRNLKQMCEILNHINKFPEKCREFEDWREKIGEALQKHAVCKNEKGETHIIHGWGDKQSYKVCTPKDIDGKCRYSATAYSFWCICEMIEKNPDLKKDILRAYEALDSKYGIKTLSTHYTPDCEPYTGSIAAITPGTYENSCAYIHSTMFAAMALFILGEGERAWKQIEKAIPITHSFVTKTPFVMPNSYCENEDYGMDGESMGDWYTGSGAVLLRNIVKFAVGIQPDLDGIMIKTASYMPSKTVNAELTVKDSKIEFIYRNTGIGTRKYTVNGKEMPSLTDSVSGTPYIYIKNSDLTEKITIEVID